MKNTILTILTVVVLAAVGVAVFTGDENNNATDNDEVSRITQPADRSGQASSTNTTSTKIREGLATYTNEEYGFSFQYPEEAKIYTPENEIQLEPQTDRPIVAAVVLPETYESSAVSGKNLNYRIEILTGAHTRQGYNGEGGAKKFYIQKEINSERFTIAYNGFKGPQVPQNVFGAYDVIESSFQAI